MIYQQSDNGVTNYDLTCIWWLKLVNFHSWLKNG